MSLSDQSIKMTHKHKMIKWYSMYLENKHYSFHTCSDVGKDSTVGVVTY